MRPRLVAAIVAAVLLPLALPTAAPASQPGSLGGAPDIQHLHGKFEVVIGDSRRRSTTAYFVEVAGTTYRLLGRTSYRLKAGQQVDVAGAVEGRSIHVSTITATTSAPPSGAAPAAMNVLVELVYWTAPDSVTSSQAQQQYGLTNNSWFGNDSYGQLSLTAAATGWMSIAAPSDPDGTGGNTPCDNTNTIQSEGDAAAQASGFNLSGFTNVVYYYPTCPNEQWGGWGEQPGSRTWLIGEMDTRVGVHELGHNLGLGHSHSAACTSNAVTVPYSGTCAVAEYGDPVSAMGGGFSGQGMFAASQQSYLGWLGTTTHAVQTVSAGTGGSFRLVPYESAAGGTQALQVTDSSGQTFWIEYRQATGNDSFLGTGETDGVLVRTGGNSSSLYDMTSATANDFGDAALPVGASWSNPLGDLSVSVTDATSTGATVAIAFGAPQFSLTVTKSGTGSGTVSSSPSGISCGTACSATLASGTSVGLTATPEPGSAFVGWGGDCSGSSTCTATMTSNRSVSAAFGTVSTGVQENSPGVSLNGWDAPPPDSIASGGTVRTSKVLGDFATFRFSGTAITWMTRKGPSQGIAAVSIDGVSKGHVDLYAAAVGDFSTTYSGLTAATHTIKIVVTGKNTLSTGTSTAVDAFKVGTALTQDTSRKVTYDRWTGAASTSASGGAYRVSTRPTSTVAYPFTGTRIDWITATGPNYGEAGVTIDGVDKGVVDLYAATQTWQVAKTYSGLSSGQHTIVVKALGTKNAAASHSKVVVDAFAAG